MFALCGLQRLNDLANTKKCTPAQIALAWLLAQKPWIVPIPGTSNPARLKENLGAMDVHLGADELKILDEFFPIDAVEGARYPAALQARVGK